MAYLELNGNHDCRHLKKADTTDSFTYHKVHFYPDATLLTLGSIAGQYDVLVLDMGLLKKELLNQFLCCDLRLVVGDVAPWKSHYLKEWYDLYHTMDQVHPETMKILGNGKGISSNQRDKALPFLSAYIPWISNPFQLTSSDWSIFMALLNRN